MKTMKQKIQLEWLLLDELLIYDITPSQALRIAFENEDLNLYIFSNDIKKFKFSATEYQDDKNLSSLLKILVDTPKMFTRQITDELVSKSISESFEGISNTYFQIPNRYIPEIISNNLTELVSYYEDAPKCGEDNMSFGKYESSFDSLIFDYKIIQENNLFELIIPNITDTPIEKLAIKRKEIETLIGLRSPPELGKGQRTELEIYRGAIKFLFSKIQLNEGRLLLKNEKININQISELLHEGYRSYYNRKEGNKAGLSAKNIEQHLSEISKELK